MRRNKLLEQRNHRRRLLGTYIKEHPETYGYTNLKLLKELTEWLEQRGEKVDREIVIEEMNEFRWRFAGLPNKLKPWT